MKINRRRLVAMVCIAPFALPGAAVGQQICGRPLTMSQRNLRRALGYVENSGDEQRQCRQCIFFGEDREDRGICQMMGGSSVNVTGVCNSFGRK